MNLQSIIDEETARGNFRGKVQVEYSSHFSGMIENFDNPQINLEIDSAYDPSNLPEIVRSLFRHEINHKGYAELPGCPNNFPAHISILEEVSNVLANAGYPNVPVSKTHTLYTYMANMFTDFVDNSQLGRRRNHFGMWLLYEEDLSKSKVSPLFDAFIRLQEYSYGNKHSKSLLRPYHTDDEKVITAVREFIQDSNLSRNLPEKDKKLLDEVLFDPSAWAELARIFTEKMLPLIEKEKLSSKEYINVTFLPLESKLFPSELDNPEIQMDLAFKAYAKGSSTFEPPKFLDPQLSLLRLYQRLAKNLEIKALSATSSVSMPVCRYGIRPFDIERDQLSDVFLDFDGRLRLKVRPHAVEMPFDYYDSIVSFPDIQFALLDTSSSTQKNLDAKSNPKIINPWSPQNLQWTDDSIYHYELLAWFGLLEYLRKQGILKTNSVKLLNFSSSQTYASNLHEAQELALSPKFGGTTLTNIASIFGSPHPKKLMFTLTDGEVSKWSDIKDDFIQRAKGQYYFHFQIGDSTPMSSDLEEANIPVFYDDGRNLGKMIIDLTRPFVNRRKK